ncbi:ferredoxin [Candidatus Parcubacteria bacterium]|nr:ferredoxin [Candidatus Parcubacteria bacterium]
MSVSIDKNLCIGCSACVSLCPKTFKMSEEEGKAEVITGNDIACAQSAADGCPARAIAIQ